MVDGNTNNNPLGKGPPTGRTPSEIATTIIRSPDGTICTGVVFVNASNRIQWMLYRGEEGIDNQPYSVHNPITVGSNTPVASKVALVSYHDSGSTDGTANQVSPYQINACQDPQDIKLTIHEDSRLL
jgi:hypothetical protein